MAAGKALTRDQRLALLGLVKISCDLFWGPEQERCREMLADDFFRPLDTAGATLVTEPPDAPAALKALVKSHVDSKALFNSLEEAYVTLFVSARGGISAPLYQSCYDGNDGPQGAGSIMGAAAVKMQQRLAALGLALDHNSNEPPDHLAIELEYLYFLLQKGWIDKSPEALSEAAVFAKTELLEWVPRFEARLRLAAPNSFYALTAAILAGALQLIADL